MLIHNTTSRLAVKPSARVSPHERLYYPVAFEPGRMLEPTHFRYGDCLIYLCHAIIMARVRDPRYAKGYHDGFVALTNRSMRNILGHRRWQFVKRLAIACRLVECDGHYWAGERSLGYRLCMPYTETAWELREVHDERLIRRLHERQVERRRVEWNRIRTGRTRVPAPVCEHLYRNLKRVQIDSQIGETLAPEVAVAVDLIRRGCFFFHVDEHGRVHTNVTNLKRTLRGCLSVNEERLANLDIANSQPLFLGLLLLGESRDPRTFYPIQERREGGGREEGGRVSICGARTPRQQGKGRGRANLVEFLDLCRRGEFYQYVQNESGLTLDSDAVKKHVFKVLFGRNGQASPVYQVLDRRFPSLMAFVRRVKRGDHRRLAHLAQRTESDFVFGRVVSRVLRERPDLFVTTIHDSVMTTVGDEGYVRDVMLAEFRKLGIEATVRIEKCARCADPEESDHGSDVPLPGPVTQ